MMMGVDPQVLAKAREAGKNIRARITIDHKSNSAVLELSTTDPSSASLIPTMLNQFAEGLATQLQAFFAITGEIVEKK